MTTFKFRCKNCGNVFECAENEVTKRNKIWEGGLVVTYVYANCPNPECGVEVQW